MDSVLEKILNLIDERGVQQKIFASDIGLNQNSVTEWKTGRLKSYRRYIDKIADYFNVSTDYLLGREENISNSTTYDADGGSMNLSNRIKELCEKNEITFAELERTLTLANGALKKWEKSSPSIDKVERVANYFGVSLDYLTGRIDTPYYRHEILMEDGKKMYIDTLTSKPPTERDRKQAIESMASPNNVSMTLEQIESLNEDDLPPGLVAVLKRLAREAAEDVVKLRADNESRQD